MKSRMKKFVGIGALALASVIGANNANAGIGVISLLGGPGGVVIIEAGAALMIGGSAAVLGTCYVGQHTAGWSEDCPIFINFTFWPGLVLLSENGAKASSQIAEQLSSKYHADSESANRIADRIYNKAIIESKLAAQGHAPTAPGERLVVQAKVSVSADELRELSEPEFAGSEGFAQLVKDYE